MRAAAGHPLGGRLLLLLVLLAGCAGSSSPSFLRYFLGIWEAGQGLPPRFIAFGYLDDQLFIHYDSSRGRAVPQVPWLGRAEEEDPKFLACNTRSAQNLELRSRGHLALLREEVNPSGGLLTWQRSFGCSLSADGQQRGLYDRYGYNGRDFLSFNAENLTWTAADAAAQVIKRKWDADLDQSQYLKAYLEEDCLERLQTFSAYREEAPLRTEPPVATVARQPGSGSLETLVCRLHGFYPKSIRAAWRRDGEVCEQETSRGGLAPNLDGTYYTWLSISIRPTDRGRYQCHVEHDRLLEPLDVTWQETASVWPLVGGILGALAAAVLLLAGILAAYIRGQRKEVKAAAPA